MAAAEVHIAGCVAYMRSEALKGIVDAIESSGLAEVPRTDERGRIVVLIERASAAQVLDSIDTIRALPGVLAVHLAYQHAEAEADLQEPQ